MEALLPPQDGVTPQPTAALGRGWVREWLGAEAGLLCCEYLLSITVCNSASQTVCNVQRNHLVMCSAHSLIRSVWGAAGDPLCSVSSHSMLIPENGTVRHDGIQGSGQLTEHTRRTFTSGSVWSRAGDSLVHSNDGTVTHGMCLRIQAAVLVGLIIRLAGDRLAGENNRICYIRTYGGSMRMRDLRTSQAVEAHWPP